MSSDNFRLLGRLKSLYKSIVGGQALLLNYHNILMEQLKLRIIEKAEKPLSNTIVHYKPLHVVISPNKAISVINS